MSDVAFSATYGDLVLDQSPFALEFGSDFGAPQSVSAVIASLLIDGEIEMWQRDSNRTVSMTVLIEWSDMLTAAEAEASLIAEASKQRNLLTINPGDGWGPSNVFDTFRAQVTWLRDDEIEQQGYRRFQLTMQAAPNVRSTEVQIVAAIGTGVTPPTPNTVTVDDCSAIGGWTNDGDASTSLSVVSGAIQVVNGASPRGDVTMVRARRDGVVSMSGTPYLAVDMVKVVGSYAYLGSAALVLDGGSALLPFASGPSPDNSAYTRVWWNLVGVSSFSTMLLRIGMIGTATNLAGYAIDKVIRTNVDPSIGTARQQFRSLVVGGTARTEGSLQIQHETAALGDVLVQTMVDDGSGHQPACRQYRVAGGSVTSDSATASGSYSPLDAVTAETYDVPARTLPEGSYSILARVKAASTSTPLITVSARTRVGSVDAAASSTAEFVSLTAGAWQIVELGRLVLPPTAVPAGSSAVVRLTASTASRVDIDDLWLFHTTLGAYSLVSCGTGTPVIGGPFNRLWLDTATLDRPEPSIWLGTQADRSDARHAGGTEIRAQGTHVFTPGKVNLFTVTSNALNAAASLSFYPRWHSNAAA